MNYRTWNKTGNRFSEIGLGMGKFRDQTGKEYQKMLEYGLEQGINFFDGCIGDFKVYPILGQCLGSCRDKVFVQFHFGAIYDRDGVYGRSRNLPEIKESFRRMMDAAHFDYIDFGMLHCVDTEEEYHTAVDCGLLDYICELKDRGIVKHIGVSTHTPDTAQRLLDTGKIEFMMFSINPAFDYTENQWGKGGVQSRSALYQRCFRENVGISVMKPFGAGQLLSVKESPLGVAFTKAQCIQYALDRPGVLTLVPGCSSVEEIEACLKSYDTTPEEKDYGTILASVKEVEGGHCVYCDHCAPCPVEIPVGLVNKYYDMARIGDYMAGDHYRQLSVNADDCVGCGECREKCPFDVDQPGRMIEISEFFK